VAEVAGKEYSDRSLRRGERLGTTTTRLVLALISVAVLAMSVGAVANGARQVTIAPISISSFPATITTGQVVTITGSVSGDNGGTDITVKRYTLPRCSSGPSPVTVLTTDPSGTFTFSETLTTAPPVSYGFIVGLSQDPTRAPNFVNPDSCVTIGPSAQLSAKATGSVLVNGAPFTSGAVRYGAQVDLGASATLRLSTNVGNFLVFPQKGEKSSFVPVRVRVPAKKSTFAVELRLVGGDIATCKKGGRKTQGFEAQAKKKNPKRSLWANGKGVYRTRGQYSSATVRGTQWLTEDTCDGTRTYVKRGVVLVRDFVHKKTVVVRAGHSYLAKPN
jgi:hypothetical protein